MRTRQAQAGLFQSAAALLLALSMTTTSFLDLDDLKRLSAQGAAGTTVIEGMLLFPASCRVWNGVSAVEYCDQMPAMARRDETARGNR
jgi:hypothetical protein